MYIFLCVAVLDPSVSGSIPPAHYLGRYLYSPAVATTLQLQTTPRPQREKQPASVCVQWMYTSIPVLVQEL